MTGFGPNPGQALLRTPENAERICELLSSGLSLRKAADQIGCSDMAIRKWVRDDPAFAADYALARDLYNEAKADEILDLADEARECGDASMTNAFRLAVDSRKWYVSKQMPKKYGDKLDVNHSGGITVHPVDYSKATVDE